MLPPSPFPKEPRLNKTKLLTTAAYYASFVAMGFSMASLGPTLPGLAENAGASLGAISILFTARGLGGLAGAFISGPLYDYLRGHRVMALMIIFMAALTALTPYAPLLWVLTAILFITGAVQGVLNVGGNALLIWVHGSQVGPFMNGLHLFFGIGTFLTPIIIAQLIVLQGGLLSTYLLLAVLILPSAAVAFLPSPPSPVRHGPQAVGKVDPIMILLIASIFGFYSGASGSFGGWIYTYSLNIGLADQTNSAYLTSLFWGALTLGRLAAIPLAMRFKPQHILRADFCGALLSLLAMLIWPRSLAAVMITSAGLGFALASIYPTTMSYAGQIMTLSGKITSYFSIGNGLLSMMIPWIIGQLFDTSGPESMTIILIIDLSLALVALALLSQRATRQIKPVSPNELKLAD